MTRFFRTSLILLGLNALLFLSFLYLHRSQKGDSTPLSNDLKGFNWSQVSKLELSGPLLSEKRVFQKEEQNWYMQQPLPWPANPYALGVLLNKLQFLDKATVLSREEWTSAQSSLADYGLEEPRLNITLWEGDKKQNFALGDTIAPGKYLYVLSPSQEYIFRADKDLLDLSLMPLEHFQRQALFEVASFEIDGIRIKSDEKNLTILLSKVGKDWHFEAPIQAEANKALVEELLHDLLSLRCQRFLLGKEAEVARAHLHSPKLRLSLLGPNYRQGLRIGEIGSSPDEYEAKLDEQEAIFTLSASIVDKLLSAQGQLRSRQIFKFKPQELQSLRLETELETMNFHRLESGEWTCQTAGPDTLDLGSDEVETASIEDALRALKHLQALDFMSDTPSELELEAFGFNEPTATFTLDLGAKQKVLLLGHSIQEGETNTGYDRGYPSEYQKRLYAKVGDSPSVYAVSAAILDYFPLDPLFYYKKTLFEMPKSMELKALELRDLEHNTTLLSLQFVEGKTDDLLSLLPDFSNNQRRNVRDFIELVKTFRVERVLSRSFSLQGYSLDHRPVAWDYMLHCIFGSKEGPETEQVLDYYFSRRLGGTLQLGGSPTLASTFRLSQDMMDALFAISFQKKPLTVEDLAQLDKTLDDPEPPPASTQRGDAPAMLKPDEMPLRRSDEAAIPGSHPIPLLGPDDKTLLNPDEMLLRRGDEAAIPGPHPIPLLGPDDKTLLNPDEMPLRRPNEAAIPRPHPIPLLGPDDKTLLNPDEMPLRRGDEAAIPGSHPIPLLGPDDKTVLKPDAMNLSKLAP